jgi:hypothetical protein
VMITMLITTVVPLVVAALAHFLIPHCPGQTPTSIMPALWVAPERRVIGYD